MSMTMTDTIESQSASRREALEDARRATVPQDDVTLPVDPAQEVTMPMAPRPRGRARNVVLVAVTIEVQCPYCGAAQPAPGGSEFCEPSEARELCDGGVASCVSCDEPIRMTWHDKVQVVL